MEIEKLGKPLYATKKVEDSKKTVKKQAVKEDEESDDENEDDEEGQNQEIPFSSSDEESDLDIQISEDEAPKEDKTINFKNDSEEEDEVYPNLKSKVKWYNPNNLIDPSIEQI
jgi:hypothetical protein